MEAEIKYPEEILMRGQLIGLLEPSKVSGIGVVRGLLGRRGYNQRTRLLYFFRKGISEAHQVGTRGTEKGKSEKLK